MVHYDFSGHQNRHIRIEDMPEEYLREIERAAQSDPYYPCWHIGPRCGLLNDPNGLVELHGEHHIFYQWFPAGPVHGLKHWYHLKTRDFVHYEDDGIAMLPEMEFDDYGCYTGMALKAEDGVHVYYTGIAGEEQIPSTCHGLFDGNMITGRELLIARDSRVCTKEYRDPFIFTQNDHYYMLTGAQNTQEKGVLLFYEGESPLNFTLRGELDLGEKSLGYMLECPNYFETKGKGILFCSPMGIKPVPPYDFQNVFSVVYGVGEPLDVKKGHFSCQEFREMDKGFDFYAPQTYRDSKGRQILLGWLGNSKSSYPTDKNYWAHMLTMPRMLSIEGEYLVQRPLEELEALKGPAVSIDEDESFSLPGACSFVLEGLAGMEFQVEIGNDKGEFARFSGNAAEFCLDRSHMTCLYAEKYGTKRRAKRLEGAQKLQLWADRSSLEIFADGGKTVFTSRIFLKDPSYVVMRGMGGDICELSPIELAYHRSL